MILDKIIENKKLEVIKAKENFPLSKFRKKIKKSDRSFRAAIMKKSEENVNIIAELKKAAPSKGILRQKYDVASIAKIYNKYADALSVVTDEKFFKGKLKDMDKARKATKLPILRKDFIIDEYQIYESRYYGADAILLIASILSKNKINNFIKLAEKLGMDCIVEVSNKRELMSVLQTNANIIGINNRNLRTFKVDIDATFRLANLVPINKMIVSESGINSREDIEKIKDSVDAALIGTALMKAKNMEAKLKELTGK